MSTPPSTEAVSTISEKLGEILFDGLSTESIEKWVYDCPYLEMTLSSDDHLTILKTDYRAARARDTLIGVLRRYVPESDAYKQQAKRLLRRAGWFEGRRLENLGEYGDMPPYLRAATERTSECPAFSHAVAILSGYGGLSVGEVGSGIECAASDIQFSDRPGMASDRWVQQFGSLVPIASAHHDHITVYVGPNGQVYLHTDPDDCLYLAGAPSTAFAKLLLGLSYGKAL